MSDGLKEYEWQLSYRTSGLNDKGEPTDILHDFYLPALNRAAGYDRVAGYFRSSSLAAASQGYTAFLNHAGHMRMIVGADLQVQDAAAILAGNHKRLSDALMEELQNSDSWSAEVKNGVSLLGTMVASGQLEVKVAFRVNAVTHEPIAVDSAEDGYVHEKWFVMRDADGNRIYGSGSLNESKTALVLNAENIDIHCDWDGARDKKRVEKAEADFDMLWQDQNPYMCVKDIPDAVRERLIILKDLNNQPIEIDGTAAAVQPDGKPDGKELLKFAVIRDAPKMPDGLYIGMYSAPVEPWPHQETVSRRLIESYPYSYMMCDEVGLGKTIEAALAVRSLVLSGRADRVMIVAPASLTDQWQRELAQKAMLPFAKTKVKPGGIGRISHAYIYPKETEEVDAELYSPNCNIISSGLVSRRERVKAVDQMEECDIVLVDEAHYARRQNPRENSLGQPRYGNLYKSIDEHLHCKAKSLWLATATPMQIDPIEVYDLFRLTDRAGQYAADPTLSMTYFRMMGKLVNGLALTGQQWGTLGKSYAQIEALDPYLWDNIQAAAVNGKNRKALSNLYKKDPMKADIQQLKKPLFCASPLARVMMRHTRQLLELYRQNGKLSSNLAKRHVRPICAIPFTAEEARFYDSLKEYCDGLNDQMRKSNPQVRSIMGFYLNFLQLRFASSFYAIEKTLNRRLIRVNNTLLVGGRRFDSEEEFDEAVELLQDSDQYDEDDLSDLTFDALLKDRTPGDLEWERDRLTKMLEKLGRMNQTPSKIQRLFDEISSRTVQGRVRQTVLFTRFYDTLDSIRRQLKIRSSDMRVGVFSGSHASWYDPDLHKEISSSHEEIKRRFRNGDIDLLLCTDAAAEGLNLQTADLLINFDMGWNPMKIEQRIGRIDRIGQKYSDIEVMNMCYLGSTEEIVYGRLCERLLNANLVVGAQQISMLPVDAEQFRKLQEGELTLDQLEAESRKRLELQKETTASMEMSAQDVYDMYDRMNAVMRQKRYPATLESVWDAFTSSPYLQSLGAKIQPDGRWFMPKTELSGEIHCTINREQANTPEEFMTWGNPEIDRLLDGLSRKLDQLSCIRRISVKRQKVELVGYAVAAVGGVRLVTAYEELKGLEMDETAVIREEEIAVLTKKLEELLEKELERMKKADDAVSLNKKAAAFHELFIGCCSAGILEQLAEAGETKYSDVLKTLTDGSRARYIVELPGDKFAGKESFLVFPSAISDRGTVAVITGELLNCCSELIQRTAAGLKKKKSEITTEEVLHRIRGRNKM